MLLKFWLVNLAGTIAALLGFAIAWTSTNNFAFALFCVALAAAIFMVVVFCVGIFAGLNDSIFLVACSTAFALSAVLSAALAPSAEAFFREPAAVVVSYLLAVACAILSLVFTGWAAYDEAENQDSIFHPDWHEIVPSAIGLAGLVLGPIELAIRRFNESRD